MAIPHSAVHHPRLAPSGSKSRISLFVKSQDKKRMANDEPDWYYADAGEHVGPFTLLELRETFATLPNAKNVFVWCEGFSDWKRAKDVPELRLGASSPPPPLHPRLLETEFKRLVFPTWNEFWKGAFIGFLVGCVIVPFKGNMAVPANFIVQIISGPFVTMVIGAAIGAFHKKNDIPQKRSRSFILALIILPLIVAAKVTMEFEDGKLTFQPSSRAELLVSLNKACLASQAMNTNMPPQAIAGICSCVADRVADAALSGQQLEAPELLWRRASVICQRQ
jgi:hypothetical protein